VQKQVLEAPKQAMESATSDIGNVGTGNTKKWIGLLVNLWEAAQRLPEESERRDALTQISGFQRRVAALVTRAF
jgi:hypothetical protein